MRGAGFQTPLKSCASKGLDFVSAFASPDCCAAWVIVTVEINRAARTGIERTRHFRISKFLPPLKFSPPVHLRGIASRGKRPELHNQVTRCAYPRRFCGAIVPAVRRSCLLTALCHSAALLCGSFLPAYPSCWARG